MPEPSASPSPDRRRMDAPVDARDLPGDFAHRHEVEVRLADTDAMGHVNNANYLTYVEIARVAYYEQVTGNALPIGTHGAEEGMILAEIRMTYRSPAFYGETITVETRVERIGRTSFGMVHRMTAPESRYGPARLIAVADSTLVSYDYTDERPIPVPDEWRTRMESYEGRSLGS
ncbi:MAG TPA: thioesterase family protein [Candidatus Limnocylindria bacterium]|nr:thioesterase family protein [Candidatus Limnocylindria bacterium]